MKLIPYGRKEVVYFSRVYPSRFYYQTTVGLVNGVLFFGMVAKSSVTVCLNHFCNIILRIHPGMVGKICEMSYPLSIVSCFGIISVYRAEA